MKKILLFILPLFVSFGVLFFIYFYVLRNSGKGAIQVTSSPKSKVFLNGKLIGVTPLCKCEAKDMIDVGEYTVRLIPEEGNFSPFEEKIKITKSILTVLDRNFGQGADSEGSIITLSKIQNPKDVELLVLSLPSQATVFLDSNKVGETPLLLKNLTSSDHEVKVTKKGYKDRSVRVHTIEGYKLLSTVYLGVTDVIEASPLETPSASPSAAAAAQVIILNTPTGFLRVREEPSLNSGEIARVSPSEKYELIDEKEGWYKIKLNDGKEGWISNQYSKKEN
ncbi:MAG: PEGA domain-containing protein [Patescibacteria group bacterium]|nr:PEGA domain-containing protein [Patescibacteria group bacterium]